MAHDVECKAGAALWYRCNEWDILMRHRVRWQDGVAFRGEEAGRMTPFAASGYERTADNACQTLAGRPVVLFLRREDGMPDAGTTRCSIA